MSANKFKAPTGQWLTRGLFYELDTSEETCLYTLKDYDCVSVRSGKTFPSLRRLYLECEDPTEYEFANKYLDGWKHWEKVLRSGLLEPYIESWRKELEVRVRSKALTTIRDIQNGEGEKRMKFEAAKFILNGGWDRKKKGRPTKDEIVEYEDKNRVLEDFERIVSPATDKEAELRSFEKVN